MIRKIKKYIDFLKKGKLTIPLEPKKKRTPFEVMMDEIDIRTSCNCKLGRNIGVYFIYTEELYGDKLSYSFLKRKYTNEDSFIEGLKKGKFKFKSIRMDGGDYPPDEYRRDLECIGILGSIMTIVGNWIGKNPIRNCEKILALLEENNIYLSNIKYDVWQRVHHVYIDGRMISLSPEGASLNQFIHPDGNGRRDDEGIFLWVDEINNEFLKSLIKVAWDPSIQYDEKEHWFKI